MPAPALSASMSSCSVIVDPPVGADNGRHDECSLRGSSGRRSSPHRQFPPVGLASCQEFPRKNPFIAPERPWRSLCLASLLSAFQQDSSMPSCRSVSTVRTPHHQCPRVLIACSLRPTLAIDLRIDFAAEHVPRLEPCRIMWLAPCVCLVFLCEV